MSLEMKLTPHTDAKFRFWVAFVGLFVGGTFGAEIKPIAVAIPLWEFQSWQVTCAIVIPSEPRPSRG